MTAAEQGLTDPARDEMTRLGGSPDLDLVRGLFPHTMGPPAFDRALIQVNIERLRTVPAVGTGHPFLDLSVKAGLAFIDATFRGGQRVAVLLSQKLIGRKQWVVE